MDLELDDVLPFSLLLKSIRVLKHTSEKQIQPLVGMTFQAAGARFVLESPEYRIANAWIYAHTFSKIDVREDMIKEDGSILFAVRPDLLLATLDVFGGAGMSLHKWGEQTRARISWAGYGHPLKIQVGQTYGSAITTCELSTYPWEETIPFDFDEHPQVLHVILPGRFLCNILQDLKRAGDGAYVTLSWTPQRVVGGREKPAYLRFRWTEAAAEFFSTSIYIPHDPSSTSALKVLNISPGPRRFRYRASCLIAAHAATRLATDACILINEKGMMRMQMQITYNYAGLREMGLANGDRIGGADEDAELRSRWNKRFGAKFNYLEFHCYAVVSQRSRHRHNDGEPDWDDV